MIRRTLSSLLAFLLLLNTFYAHALETITDATGHDLPINASPSRIVTLTPSADEILYALGLDEEVVGVTTFTSRPEYTESAACIGTLLDPDAELIISLRPDLVIATVEGNRKEGVMRIRRAGIPVFVMGEVAGFEDLYRRIDDMGTLVGRSHESAVLIADLKKRILALKTAYADAAPVRVLLQLNEKPIITINADTVLHEVLSLAGGENIAFDAPTRYPVYSREEIVSRNPEVIIMTAMGTKTDIARDAWSNFTIIDAVANDRIYVMDSVQLCTIGPRLVDAAEEIAAIIHRVPTLPEGAYAI